MGYNSASSTTTLNAKLTPLGRKKLIMTNNNLIQSFSLGDSDSNYLAATPLASGQIPTNSGDKGPNNTVSNSVAPDVKIKSFLLVDKNGNIRKMVEPQSSEILTEFISNGTVTQASNVTQNYINRNNLNTDSLINLYYSFNLPLDATADFKFKNLTQSQGGFANTGLSALSTTEIVVIGIDNTIYGEMIDGKSIKLEIETALPKSYTIYSTYQDTGIPLTVQDANYKDTASNTTFLGDNIALLVSDDIKTPNGGDATLSWATGYNTVKPFSNNNKQLFNLTTDTNLNQYADTIVGVAYLDKGFLVLTHPEIVQFFDISTTATTVTFNHLSTSVSQVITCIANRGEFANSTNPTFKTTDTPRISEVGLYDVDNDLIAIAKSDRHIVKNINDFLALSIKFSV